jgi:glycosyltransferase involved in cell wall biosynthesis
MTRRLLAIGAVDHPGGAEVHLLRLAAGLHARGWQITLTTPGRGRLAEEAQAAGFRWEPLPVGGLRRGAGAPALGSWRRARALARHAEVVYLNGTVAGRLLPALPGRRAVRVLHVHDMVRRVPRFWRRGDLVLADSGAVAARLRELRGLDAQVVYGPVDLDPPELEPPWQTLHPGAAVIGFVGRIEPRKGPLDLVRAAPAIRAGAPGARIVLIGDDPYESDPAYAEQVVSAATPGGPDYVDGIQRVPWSEHAQSLMRHLDVLVLPSYEEPFGTVLAEAMAVGTPVVATRVDGLPEVVDDGITGRLVPPGAPDRLAAAVLEVLADRERMGAAARERARRFSTAAYVARVEGLLLAALDGRGGTAPGGGVSAGAGAAP